MMEIRLSDHIEFQCSACNAKAAIDDNNPPNDSDPLICTGCGVSFGPYGEVKAKMVEMGKALIDDLVYEKFGAKPTWTKK